MAENCEVSKTAALGFQLFFAQKSIRLRFERLHVNHLNKKTWYRQVRNQYLHPHRNWKYTTNHRTPILRGSFRSNK